jgi:alkylation response protein AidB-like acyl-CoA dehydrogenase
MQDADALLSRVAGFAASLQAQRAERQSRRKLDPADFERLRAIGLHLAAIPVGSGGLWQDAGRSMRPMCEALRLIATGDPSLALTASMHPGVLAFWRDTVPPVPSAAWEAQKQAVFATVPPGAWWGTVSSEPGSGGDVARTRSIARPQGDGLNYRLTGEKHFGSGSGATSFMLTVARPEGEQEPAWFFLDVRGVPWDGSAGMRLRAEWDGHGMTSTNSHGFQFEDFPATRLAWPGSFREVQGGGGSVTMFFSAVFVGIVDAAMAHVREQLRPAQDSLRPFEQMEWVMADREAWLIHQAYEGGLRAFKQSAQPRRDTALAKATIATLAESVLGRLCRLSGGGSFARRSPLGFWFEDVRALGFLRPPWAVAADAGFALSFE